jgi:hypothetical protein
MRDLDAYRSALGEILPEISWYEASGVLTPSNVREARAAHIDALESGLRAQFDYEPDMKGAFYLLGESARVAKRDAQLAFERPASGPPARRRPAIARCRTGGAAGEGSRFARGCAQ